MNDDLDKFVYVTANEKVVNMICTIELTLAFLEEYKIKPDEAVKNALTPLMKEIKDWVDGK